MQHTATTSHLSHTVDMSVAEACQLMAFLAEAVRMATGPQIATHKEFDMAVTIPTGQKLNGGLTVIVRP